MVGQGRGIVKDVLLWEYGARASFPSSISLIIVILYEFPFRALRMGSGGGEFALRDKDKR
jgi:hypothetical protein